MNFYCILHNDNKGILFYVYIFVLKSLYCNVQFNRGCMPPHISPLAVSTRVCTDSYYICSEDFQDIQ